MAGSGEKWRWADPQGVQRIVHSDELRAALASGALPPYTLVWRSGMLEWQPAYQVGELATMAISAQQGVIPNIPPPPLAMVAVQAEFERRANDDPPKDREAEPPPPPVHRYAAIAAAVPEHVKARPSARVASKTSPARAGAAETSDAHPALVTPEPPPASSKPGLPPASSKPTGQDVLRAPPVSPSLPAPPGARPSATPPPPPRRSHPAPASHPGRSLAPMPIVTMQPGHPSLDAPRGGPPAPIIVPAPQTFDKVAITRSPPFGGNGETAHLPIESPVFAAGSLGEGSSQDGAASSLHGSADLPAFPLDEFEIDPPGMGENGTPAAPSDPPVLPFEQGIGSRLSSFAVQVKDRWMTKVVPPLVRGWKHARSNPKDPKVIALAGGGSLLAVLLVVMLVARSGDTAHAAGESDGSKARAAAPEPVAEPPVPSAQPTEEPRGSAPLPAPAAAEAAPLAACRVTKEAARFAIKASKDVPLEISMSPTGERAHLGFSTDTNTARGIWVDTASFKLGSEFGGRAGGKLRAVLPMAVSGKTMFVINADGKRDKLQPWRTLSVVPPLVIGWADGAVSVASRSTESPRALWSLDGEEPPDAMRMAHVGEQGDALVFRRRGAIFAGMLGQDQAVQGGLVQVVGAGAPPGSPVGAPTIASNGRAVAVAFADRASAAEPWSLRIGLAPLGSLPAQTLSFAVPPGGPGGASSAPVLAGLSDGRWLLVWTEGSGGNHDVRAQTLSADLTPLGTPFAVSHSGGNAGQGVVAVSAAQGLVAYLALTDHGYEVWGAGVDCR